MVKPWTKIINQMLHTEIFPEQLKISKVLPLHKANDKMSLTNYRPIALLPSISKIFECVLLEQLTIHFTDNNLLSPLQYGFRAKHSTELAALNLVDYLTYKLDTGNIPINISIDLSKAFDTLIHDILLHIIVSSPFINKYRYNIYLDNNVYIIQSLWRTNAIDL